MLRTGDHKEIACFDLALDLARPLHADLYGLVDEQLMASLGQRGIEPFRQWLVRFGVALIANEDPSCSLSRFPAAACSFSPCFAANVTRSLKGIFITDKASVFNCSIICARCALSASSFAVARPERCFHSAVVHRLAPPRNGCCSYLYGLAKAAVRFRMAQFILPDSGSLIHLDTPLDYRFYG